MFKSIVGLNILMGKGVKKTEITILFCHSVSINYQYHVPYNELSHELIQYIQLEHYYSFALGL